MTAHFGSRSLALAAALALAFGPQRAAAQAPAAVAPSAAASSDMSAGTAPTGEGARATSTVPLSDDPALEYKRGTQAYALGNYEQAVAHFERSYQLSNHPDLLYNLGMAYGQWYGLSADAGHLRKARRLFQNYIKALENDAESDPAQRSEAETQISRLDEQIAAHEARVAAPRPEGPRAAEGPVAVDQPPDRAARPVHKKGWFWAVIGVAALAVAGGVTAGVLLGRREGKDPELGTIGPLQGQISPLPGLRF